MPYKYEPSTEAPYVARMRALREANEDLSSKHESDYAFAEAVRKKKYKDYKQDEFYMGLFGPEPKTTYKDVAKAALKQFTPGDHTTGLVERTQKEEDAAAAKAAPVGIGDSINRGLIAANLAQNPNQEEENWLRGNTTMAQPRRLADDMVTAYYAAKSRAADQRLREIRGQTYNESKVPAVASEEEIKALEQEREESAIKAMNYSNQAKRVPAPDNMWNMARVVAGQAGTILPPAIGVGLATAPVVGPTMGAMTGAGFASGVSQTTNQSINQQYIPDDVPAEEAVRRAAAQTETQGLIQIPLDTASAAVWPLRGAGKIVNKLYQGLVQGGANVLSYGAGEYAVGREPTREGMTLAGVTGSLLGSVLSPGRHPLDRIDDAASAFMTGIRAVQEASIVAEQIASIPGRTKAASDDINALNRARIEAEQVGKGSRSEEIKAAREARRLQSMKQPGENIDPNMLNPLAPDAAAPLLARTDIPENIAGLSRNDISQDIAPVVNKDSLQANPRAVEEQAPAIKLDVEQTALPVKVEGSQKSKLKLPKDKTADSRPIDTSGNVNTRGAKDDVASVVDVKALPDAPVRTPLTPKQEAATTPQEKALADSQARVADNKKTAAVEALQELADEPVLPLRERLAAKETARQQAALDKVKAIEEARALKEATDGVPQFARTGVVGRAVPDTSQGKKGSRKLPSEPAVARTNTTVEPKLDASTIAALSDADLTPAQRTIVDESVAAHREAAGIKPDATPDDVQARTGTPGRAHESVETLVDDIASDYENTAAFSTSRAKPEPRPASELLDEVTRGTDYEAKEARALLAAGNLVVYEGGLAGLRAKAPDVAAAIEAGLRKKLKLSDTDPLPKLTVNGFNLRGKVYLDSHAVPKDKGKSLIVHEAFSHGWADTDAGVFAAFVSKLNDLLKFKDKRASAARADAESKYSHDHDIAKETLAKWGDTISAETRKGGAIGRSAGLYRSVLSELKRITNKGLEALKLPRFKYTDQDLFQALRRKIMPPDNAPYVVKNGVEDPTFKPLSTKKPGSAGAAYSFDLAAAKAKAKAVASRVLTRPGDWRSGDPRLRAAIQKMKQEGTADGFKGNPIMDKMYKMFSQDESTWDAAVKYMNGDRTVTLSPEAKSTVEAARAHIEELSRKAAALIDDAKRNKGLSPLSPEAKRLDTIVKKFGEYTTRAYQVNDDRQWKQKVMKTPAWDEALVEIEKAWTVPKNIASLPKKDMYRLAKRWGLPADTDANLLAKLVAISKKTPEEYKQNFLAFRDMLASYVDRSAAGAKMTDSALRKAMGVVMARRHPPAWLKALWGEYTNPTVIAGKTAERTSAFVNGLELQLAVREMTDLVSPPENPKVGHNRMLDGEQYGPLNGYYVSKENLEMIESALGLNVPKMQGIISKTASFLSAWIKVANIGMSTASASAQLAGNTIGTISTGHGLNPYAYKNLGTAVKGGVISAFELNTEGGMRALVEQFVRLGVLQDSVLARETKDMAKRLTNSQMVDESGNNLNFAARGMSRARDKAMGFFAATDEIPKLFNALAELDVVMRAFPDMPKQKQLELAAERTRKRTVTFSMAPDWIKATARQGLVFPFATFMAESVRSFVGNMHVAVSDISSGNKVLVAAGVRSLIGTGMVLGAGSFIAWLNGDSDEDMRNTVPEYDRNSALLNQGKDENGQIQYLNTDRYSPYPIITGILNAALRGDGEGALWAMLKPIGSEGMGVRDLATVSLGLMKESDGTLTATEEADYDRSKKRLFAFMWPQMVAAPVKAMAGWNPKQKDGTFDFSSFVGEMLGYSPRFINAFHGSASSLARATYNYTEENKKAMAEVVEGLVGEEAPTQEYVNELVLEGARKDKAAFQEYHDAVGSLKDLTGKEDKDVLAAMKEWNLNPRKDVKAGLLSGKYVIGKLRETMNERAYKRETGRLVGEGRRAQVKAEKYTKQLESIVLKAFDNAQRVLDEEKE